VEASDVACTYNPRVIVEPGTTLLHYRIVDKIGEGGMGAVWKAVDTTLDREVAIKVLLSQLAAQPERLVRFDREAKLLASLNHPNIAAVHGFQEHEGVRFVVMELVNGEDLSQRIERLPRKSPRPWPRRTTRASFIVT
jgi:serine/threonine-protein kinase